MSLYDRLQTAMQKAMKEGEREKATTLRTLMARLKEKTIDKGKDLTETEEQNVLQQAAKQRREAIGFFKKGNRDDLVQAETRELSIIESYLPKPLSLEDLIRIVEEIIKETGAETQKDMGRVMPAVMREVYGRADGKMVQELVRERLSRNNRDSQQ
ncbi:MAG: GatB/YqeY domain-containing protein [Fidelibacterota bacterium]